MEKGKRTEINEEGKRRKRERVSLLSLNKGTVKIYTKNLQQNTTIQINAVAKH